MRKFVLYEELMSLPSPVNISIMWNMGSLLGVMLGFQILTGIFLSMHYTADMENTFNSIIHIMRDVPNGWIFRLLHANGASFFFILMYLHIGRGLYYQSFYTQYKTWMMGVTIFIISMATAFLGYVLPWGQMSFWGATVITNLLSAIPYFGSSLVEWVWGGFSVGQSTLNRFFSLHFLLPFIILILSVVHLIFLHDKGSTNLLGNLAHSSKISFHPYFSIKDLVGVLVVFLFLLIVIFFYPSILTDPENFIKANPMVTPVHIQPEWYFLFAYAILRSISSKLGGVVALGLAIMILYILVLSKFSYSYPSSFNPSYQILFWFHIIIFLVLTWLGSCPIEEPYLMISKPFTFFYFSNYLCFNYFLKYT
uniref:Cytochrome b n=1 Tax=Succineidae gen. n. sp. z RM-2021 TaxID=2871687 RepID=A0A977TKK5_9EUPU|nr:cob [Succineidae gen. n. sp. z RM-2021]